MKRFKPTTKFTQILFYIAFAVLMYALINNLSVVADVFWFLTDLLEPLIIGGILAFFLSVPMRGLEQLLAKGQIKRGKRCGSGPTPISAWWSLMWAVFW